MKVKKGVVLDGCRAEIITAAITVIAPIFKLYGEEAVITSGIEKHRHSVKRSAHYRGDALDWRHRFFDYDTKLEVVQSLKDELGSHFVVVLEQTHIHIHYAPVYEA